MTPPTIKENKKGYLIDYFKDSIYICWTVEDVLDYLLPEDKTLSVEDARLVLEFLLDNYNANFGIAWDSIDYAIGELTFNKAITVLDLV